jgi:predicted HicB family RNase H-like nuclease
MAVKSPQKGDQPRMRKLAFRVEESLAKTLKVMAAQADISMARYIEQVLKDHVKEGGKKQ